MSEPRGTVAPMGTVISLQGYRRWRDRGPSALGRLDAAVGQLDHLLHDRGGSLTPTIERELRAITQAVSAGDPGGAARRAERLAGILEHPAASG